MPGIAGRLDHGADAAALGVAQDHDAGHAQHAHGVFQCRTRAVVAGIGDDRDGIGQPVIGGAIGVVGEAKANAGTASPRWAASAS